MTRKKDTFFKPVVAATLFSCVSGMVYGIWWVGTPPTDTGVKRQALFEETYSTPDAAGMEAVRNAHTSNFDTVLTF
ncbi:MAG: hypothetical protein KC777_06155 [Cyanobacteria bacterium HKST-UBA02]|nr:hypothetical protein [Cyanobacteria bacterium HKST-UBA02]